MIVEFRNCIFNIHRRVEVYCDTIDFDEMLMVHSDGVEINDKIIMNE